MAKIYARESAYSDEKKKNLWGAVVFYGIGIFFFATFALPISNHGAMRPFSTNVMLMLTFAVAGLIGKYFWGRYQIAGSGDTGVEHALDAFKALPDDYAVLTNVYAGAQYFRLVVVGANGVFIINTKNHNGKITPTGGKEWLQEKVGRRGTHYVAKMSNPVQQLKYQIYSMAQYLKQNDFRVWVDGIVYFTNETVILNGCSDQYTNRAAMVVDFILNYKVRKPLGVEEQQQIVSLLRGQA